MLLPNDGGAPLPTTSPLNRPRRVWTSSAAPARMCGCAAPGTGAQIRDHGHVVALEHAALAASAIGGTPHRRKERIPPGEDALAAAQALRHNTTETSLNNSPAAATAPVIDLTVYERAAQNRTQLP